ncbi:MAG: hypothetical protein JST37_09595 [Bacteroidetes bacterium]|nr:hypothetical protein [Bacteroidota bacterium]
MEVEQEQRSASEIVHNLLYTIGEIIGQIKNKGPLPLYQKSYTYESEIDFYGIIERVCLRIDFSFSSETPVGGLIHGQCPDGLIYERNGKYDHRPLLALLEETFYELRTNKFKSVDEVEQLYKTLRARILELR